MDSLMAEDWKIERVDDRSPFMLNNASFVVMPESSPPTPAPLAPGVHCVPHAHTLHAPKTHILPRKCYSLASPIVRITSVLVSPSFLSMTAFRSHYLNLMPFWVCSPPRPHVLISCRMFSKQSNVSTDTPWLFWLRTSNWKDLAPSPLRHWILTSPGSKSPAMASQATFSSPLGLL